MPSFLSAAALVASASIAFAAPAEIVGRSTFHIDQVAGPKVIKAGAIAQMKAYQKYNKAVPTAIAAAAAAAQTGSVAANPEQYDSSYLCPVKVGSDTLNLDFDTGSSDLWVFSTKTPKSEQGSHSLYNPSTGTLKSGYTWDISYGDGSGAQGIVYADKVVVGGVTATSQAVEVATSLSSQFVQDTDNDGLLGLAFSSINTVQPQPQTTFFDTVKSSLSKQLFAADLKAGEAGSYQFGYIDTSKYSGSVTYVSVDNSQGFWGFTAGAGGAGGASGSSIGSSIADTGTTLMYLPDATVDAYYDNVDSASYDDSQQGYTFDCDADLPDFVVEIGSGTFTVPGSYINYAPADGNSCFGGIQSNSGIGLTIFGDIFLKSVYAIFDQTKSSPRLGFAQQ